MGQAADELRDEGITRVAKAIKDAQYPAGVSWNYVAATAAFDAVLAFLGETWRGPELLRDIVRDIDKICSEAA